MNETAQPSDKISEEEMKTIDSCPDCHASLAQFMRFDQHTNGKWNLKVSFRCGATYQYIPNYLKVYLTAPCPEGLEMQRRKQKRTAATRSLHEFIMSLDVDEYWKSWVKEAIRHIK